MPVGRGMKTSRRTTSGWSSAASRAASMPSLASPTISMRGSKPSTICSPRRYRTWSSATRTRMRSCSVTGSPTGAIIPPATDTPTGPIPDPRRGARQGARRPGPTTARGSGGLGGQVRLTLLGADEVDDAVASRAVGRRHSAGRCRSGGRGRSRARRAPSPGAPPPGSSDGSSGPSAHLDRRVGEAVGEASGSCVASPGTGPVRGSLRAVALWTDSGERRPGGPGGGRRPDGAAP